MDKKPAACRTTGQLRQIGTLRVLESMPLEVVVEYAPNAVRYYCAGNCLGYPNQNLHSDHLPSDAGQEVAALMFALYNGQSGLSKA